LQYLLSVDKCGSPDGCDSDAAGDVPMRRFAAVVMVAELAVAVEGVGGGGGGGA